MCAHKRALIYLLFHAGLVKCNFVFGKRINVMASLVDFFFLVKLWNIFQWTKNLRLLIYFNDYVQLKLITHKTLVNDLLAAGYFQNSDILQYLIFIGIDGIFPIFCNYRSTSNLRTIKEIKISKTLRSYCSHKNRLVKINYHL